MSDSFLGGRIYFGSWFVGTVPQGAKTCQEEHKVVEHAETESNE